MGNRLEGRALRSRLLVGVAAAAMAAPAANRALAADPGAKWSPYVEAGGMVGTHSFGDVDIFIPVWQDQTSILFGDLRGTFSAQPTEEGNFGLGYRTQISPEWILGGYGYFDIANSPNNNLFYQITLGVELKSVDWDFRLNGYIPINPDGGSVNNNSNAQIKISGNTIQMTTESRSEKALYGFDGEVGWRVPVFPADGDFDLRVYAGGYYFTNSNVDTIAGPRGRIEARLYDIDFLGLQSRLTAQGVIQWDAPRGTQGWGGLELRIPLGAVTGSPAAKLNPLDRRMVDRVVRDIDIVTEKTTPKKTSEDVIVDELTVSTHTIVFANSNGAGSGAKGSPIDLNLAPSRGQSLGSNAIILADGGNGNIAISNPLQLSNGQALIGGGSIVPLTGAKTGKTVDFQFSGSRPTLVGNNSAANAIDMASGTQNEIWGVDIAGQFSTGVYGHNKERAIVKYSTITSANGRGIFLLNKSDGIPTSQFIDIRGDTITGGRNDGIAVLTYITDTTAHSQTVLIADNVVEHGNREGIFLLNGVTGAGSSLSQTATINDNTATSNGGAGIYARNYAVSGGAISQALTIDPNTAKYNGDSGIKVGNFASSAATIVQTAVIEGNFVRQNNIAGIYVENVAETAGSITQTLNIVDNTAEFNSGSGIDVRNKASVSGIISQAATLSGDTANNNGENGIFVYNAARSGSTVSQALLIANESVSYNSSHGINIQNRGSGIGAIVSQTVLISDVVVTRNASVGIYLGNHFSSGAGLSQSVLIDPSVITDNSQDGIFNKNFFSGDGHFDQTISIQNNTIANNRSNGVYVGTFASSATVSQTILIGGNSIANNGGDGVRIKDFATSGSTVSQTVTIAGNSITDSGSRGIYVRASGRGDTTIVQNVAITGNEIDNSRSDEGIRVVAFDSSFGGSLTQNVMVTGNTVSHTSHSGIYVIAGATSIANFVQTVTVADNTISNTGNDSGVYIHTSLNVVANRASSTISVAGNNISNIGNDAGVYIHTSVRSATLTQDLTITDNSIGHVALFGINVHDQADSSGVLSQTAVITNNSIDQANTSDLGAGIWTHSNVSGGGASVSQALTIASNSLSNIQGSNAGGVIVGNYASVGGAMTQTASIVGNVIDTLNATGPTTNSAIGIWLINSAGIGGTISQTASVDDNTISNLHGDFAGGVYNLNRVSGAGAVLSQTLTIDPNTVSGLHGNVAAVGIGVATKVSNGGAATQTIAVANNFVSDVNGGLAAAGVNLQSRARNATLSQAIAITGNSIDAVSASGIAGGVVLQNLVSDGGVARQALSVSGNAITGIDGGVAASGIYVGTHLSNATFSGAVNIAGNAVSVVSGGIAAFGIDLDDHATSGTLSQTVDITGNAVSSVTGLDGVFGIADFASAGTNGVIGQNLTIAGNTVTSAGTGIAVYSQASSAGSSVSQAIAITGNTVSHNGFHGVAIRASGESDGAVTQGGTIVNNLVSGNHRGGVVFGALAEDANPATAKQTFDLTSNTVSGNLANGVYLLASGGGATQVVTLTTTLPGNQIVGNGSWGVLLHGSANANQTFHANSTSLGGAGPNVISGNTSGTYHLSNAGGAVQSFTP